MRIPINLLLILGAGLTLSACLLFADTQFSPHSTAGDVNDDRDQAVDHDLSADPDLPIDPDVAGDPDGVTDPDGIDEPDGVADLDAPEDPDGVDVTDTAGDPDTVGDPDTAGDPDMVEDPDLDWVTITGGSFQMGSNLMSAEQPVHTVTIATFEMTQTEVTQAQYRACVNDGVCGAASSGEPCNWGVVGRDTHPINCVNWGQASVFCGWAGGRLPSEAEWEYAARSRGQTATYPWGEETPSCSYAIMYGNESYGCGENHTFPVCSRPDGNTDQGLCDMAGNVWEWVEDDYHDSYNGAPNQGEAWFNPDDRSLNRIVRGGGYPDGCCDDYNFLRTTYRGFQYFIDANIAWGFRCVR